MAGNLVIAINTYKTPKLFGDVLYDKIEYLDYDSDSGVPIDRTANNLKDCYDEVYVLQFDSYDMDFITAIRKTGKRIK